VEARIAALEKQVGTLLIVGKVPGSTVLLDEEPVERGRALAITAGKHRLVANKDGYLSRTLEVIVAPGLSSTVEVDPLPPQDKVIVVAPPAEAPPPKRSRWWVGVLVAGVAVAGGAVALGVAFGLPPRVAEPYSGNLTPGLQRFDP
jgi:hypothetical protein